MISQRYKQVGALYGTMAVGLLVGIGISVINTRFLGPQQYGDLKFLQSIFIFTVTFFTLGLFVTGSRVLAREEREARKNDITGSLLVLAAIMSVCFSITIFCFSFYEERLFDNRLGRIIRLFSPLLFVYPFQVCLENIMQGSNRIYDLSAFRLLPQMLYMAVAFCFNFFVPLDLTVALAIQFVVLGLTVGMLILKLKPKLANIKENIELLWNENKSYGFHVYLGSLAGVATAQFGGISIAYYIDNINVGFYALAMTISMPLGMVPTVVGTTLFKDFANSEAILRSTVMMTVILSLTSLFVFLIVIEDMILLLYSEDYLYVAPLAFTMALGSIFHGFGDFINRFLGAHGRGIELRNGAIAVGVTNILGFLVLVRVFGVDGAAATRVVSGIIYLAAMFFYYRKYQHARQLFTR